MGRRSARRAATRPRITSAAGYGGDVSAFLCPPGADPRTGRSGEELAPRALSSKTSSSPPPGAGAAAASGGLGRNKTGSVRYILSKSFYPKRHNKSICQEREKQQYIAVGAVGMLRALSWFRR